MAVGQIQNLTHFTKSDFFVQDNHIRDVQQPAEHPTASDKRHKRRRKNTAIMAATGDKYGNDLVESDSDSAPGTPAFEPQNENGDAMENLDLDGKKPRSSILKTPKTLAPPVSNRPELPPQTEPKDLDVKSLTPLTAEIIARQATINIGTIGHVAHGKSTVVKAISGVQTVRFKNELERNITIKLGYANAKIYKCDNEECPRPGCYRSYKSEKEVDPPCEREGCGGRYRLIRHVS